MFKFSHNRYNFLTEISARKFSTENTDPRMGEGQLQYQQFWSL
jgi:hypothetical protein